MRRSPALVLALAAALLLAPTILAQSPEPTPTPTPAPTPMHPEPVPTPPPTNGTAPENDLYWDAVPIAPGESLSQSLAGATVSWWDASSCSYAANVWYRVSAPNATGLHVEVTSPDGASVALAAYRWYPSYENLVACGASGNGSASTLDAGVIPGEYLIEVLDVGASGGNVTITVTTDDSLAPYELVAPYLYLRADPVVGEPNQIRAAVQSLGKPVDVPFSVAFYVGGWYVGETRVQPLGNTSWTYVDMDFVPQFAGNLSFAYYVDSAGELAEFSERNNFHEMVIEVLPEPDLQVDILELRRVPLRTELGDLRHPLALWEMDVEVCNLGGGFLDATLNLTLQAGGEYGGGNGAMSLGSSMEGPGPLTCYVRSFRFSTANVVGDFTVIAEGWSDRDHSWWNNDDRAYGFNVVAENGGVIVTTDGLLP